MYVLDRFDVLMSKMIFKKWKNIIDMHFGMKSYLKSTHNHTAKHALFLLRIGTIFFSLLAIRHLLFFSCQSTPTKKKKNRTPLLFFSLRNLNIPHLYLQLFYDYLLSFIGLIDKRDGELNLVAYMWYCGDHPSGVESSWWWGKNMKFLFLISKKEIESSYFGY